jgi:hypothetical protein
VCHREATTTSLNSSKKSIVAVKISRKLLIYEYTMVIKSLIKYRTCCSIGFAIKEVSVVKILKRIQENITYSNIMSFKIIPGGNSMQCLSPVCSLHVEVSDLQTLSLKH